MSATNNGRVRAHIGSICYRGSGNGGHVALIGNSDYGACGSKYYAEVYVVVEAKPDWEGEVKSAEDVAEYIAQVEADAEAHRWCECGDREAK